MSNLIKIRGIIRDFKLGQETVHVLKGIDLDIERGEYVAIMGPSGSGKSTLMNILGCLDTPTAGSYILNGKDVSKMSDDELADIVALPMIYAGVSKNDRIKRAQEVLANVGLSDRMDHKPNQLSGGQRQRVAVGERVEEPELDPGRGGTHSTTAAVTE